MTDIAAITGSIFASDDARTGPLKHRWSVAHNLLGGVTLGMWLRLVRENRFQLDPAYWHRSALISAVSPFNSVWHLLDRWRFARDVDRARLPEDPLFILGHWRSGTTHLHNLLAVDAENFAYPTTYQVANPLGFLSSEPLNKRLFRWMVPKTRPMDNMALGFDLPQEDELALCLMCGKSPYLGLVFPARERHYRRYLTFRDASMEEADQWKRAFLLFARKLTLKYGRALVFKSPPHTARVRLLLELFPNARFVHIHRDPYDVFRTSRHYFDTAAWYAYLQRPDRGQVDEQILERYVEMYDAYFTDRSLIPPGRLCEVAFADLEREPVREVRRIYDQLGIAGFDRIAPRLTDYVASLSGYRKNCLDPLPAPLQDRVATMWRRSFCEWGYRA
jgi:hypothetical protein